MDLGLRERAAVVTGGSSGIGVETAARLSDEGASVLLIGRRDEARALFDKVASIDEDRIVRRYLNLIEATVQIGRAHV